jgi:hypothetical protein
MSMLTAVIETPLSDSFCSGVSDSNVTVPSAPFSPGSPLSPFSPLGPCGPTNSPASIISEISSMEHNRLTSLAANAMYKALPDGTDGSLPRIATGSPGRIFDVSKSAYIPRRNCIVYVLAILDLPPYERKLFFM